MLSAFESLYFVPGTSAVVIQYNNGAANVTADFWTKGRSEPSKTLAFDGQLLRKEAGCGETLRKHSNIESRNESMTQSIKPRNQKGQWVPKHSSGIKKLVKRLFEPVKSVLKRPGGEGEALRELFGGSLDHISTEIMESVMEDGLSSVLESALDPYMLSKLSAPFR